jgi:hypothetical protein
VLRSITALIVGYVVFALSAVLLFQIAGQAPHAAASVGFMVGSTLYGIAFACLGGWLAARIAATPTHAPRWPALGMAAIITLGAAISLAFELRRGGAIWSPLSALLFMPPAALAGGALFWRFRR